MRKHLFLQSESFLKPVTVSVVSHLQAKLVGSLLADLSRYCSPAIHKVVLTCNLPEPLPACPDDLAFPLEVIHNPQPMGFGANHNQAFKRCDSEWFLVINPDVRLQSDVLTNLLQRATPRTGLLAPQELNVAGERVENLRGLITPWELFQRQVRKCLPPPPAHGGWVKGMFMLVRAAAYREAQGFDERFFMYCEDFDLCARLVLKEWAVDHHDDLTVMHAWQRDSHKSSAQLRRHLASLARMWTSESFWRYRQWLGNKALTGRSG